MKICKLQALSNECCLDFIGQSIDKVKLNVVSTVNLLFDLLIASLLHHSMHLPLVRPIQDYSQQASSLRARPLLFSPFTRCLNVRGKKKWLMWRIFLKQPPLLVDFCNAERYSMRHWMRVGTTAPRLGNAVSVGHRPRLMIQKPGSKHDLNSPFLIEHFFESCVIAFLCKLVVFGIHPRWVRWIDAFLRC